MATLAELQARESELLNLIRFSRRRVDSFRTRLSIYESELQTAVGDRATQVLNLKLAAQDIIKQEEDNLRRYETELAQVQNQIANFQQQPAARQSTGVTVKEDQAANADGADTQNPNVGPQVITAAGRVTPAITNAPTNAERFNAGVSDAGTDDPVRKQAQLMATPSIVAQPGPAQPNPGAPRPSQTSGAAAAGDDNSPRTAVSARVANIFDSSTAKFNEKFQPNILDNYASYSYSISLYIMNAKDYQNMLRTKNKTIPGYQLLMQSAGAAAGVAGVVDPNVAADDFAAAALEAEKSRGRNQFFPLDYYIDDVQLQSLIHGKGTNAAHNVAKLSFKIIEPNGISLLDNLYRATQQYCNLNRTPANLNYAAQNYLMVIRWYGYDINGNLVPPGKTGQDAPGSDVNAIVEKFIPFQFTSIKFRVANRLTEYECQAVCPQTQVGASRGRASIPYNIEIASQTLKELFVGNLNATGTAQSAATAAGETAQTAGTAGRANSTVASDARFNQQLQNSSIVAGTGSSLDLELGGAALATGTVVAGNSPTQSQAPQKANAAANPTLTSGFITAINNVQKDLVKEGIIGSADEYSIVFTDDIIASAKVVPPGSLNKQAIAFNSKKNSTAADQKLPSKSTPNTNTKTQSALAGMSILQFLDQCLRTSTYIYDQQTKIIDKDGKEVQQNGLQGVTAWYHIDIEAKPKEYDFIRNDYSYYITYRVSPYKINDLQSVWFPQSKYQGVHKKYNYWFTGQNSAILNLEQDYNYLYYLVINTGNRNTGNQTTNYREYLKRYYQPNSNQSTQGITNSDVNEPSANAADYLYSPADQARVKMKIVGDPAWIQQGELWEGVTGLQMNYNPFLPDGTINFSAQEVLFELLYNKPVDYDLGTGLMDPGQKNYGANRQDGRAGEATQSYIYKAREVISHFSRGQFTQDLDGVIIFFPLSTDQQIANNPQSTAPATGTRTPVLGQQADLRRGDAADTAIVLTPTTSAFARLRPYLQSRTNSNISEFGELFDPDAALLQGADQNPPALPLNTSAPTSGTQVVGPASSAAAVNNQGGASGFSGQGTPTVQVYTSGGQTVSVTAQSQIQALLDQGSISAPQFQTYSQQLAVKQTAANSPTANTALQRGIKES